MPPLNFFLDAIDFFAGHSTFNGPGGFHLEGSFLFVYSILTFFAVIYVASLIWVWQDARQRGKSSLVTVVFILLTGWPASFIWWFWLRPPLKIEDAISPSSTRQFAS